MIASAAPEAPPPRPRMRGWDWVVLAALFLLAVAPLTGLVVRTIVQGGVITGADGYLVTDPMQYLNWLRQSGEYGAAANLYDLAPGPRSFVHPGLLISGLAYRAGAGVVVAYQLWKPVAVAALFFGSFYFAGRFLVHERDRRTAVILALFFATPIAAAVGWSVDPASKVKFDLDFVGGELWTGTYLWGYLFTAVGVGLMPLGLLAFERARQGSGRRYLAAAAAVGLVVSWMQPWQGATYLIILCVAVPLFVLVRPDRREQVFGAAAQVVVVALVTALPLIYYWALSKLDPSWRLAGEVNNFGRWPFWVTLVGLAPLAIPALFAYRQKPRNLGDWMLRVWPLAGLAVFYLPFGTFPFHAFQGLALPLAVLSLLAVRRWLGERPLPLWGAALAVFVLAVPGTLYRADELRGAVNAGRQAFFLEPGDRDALRWMEAQPGPGGILAANVDGAYISAYTGREVWTGAGSWTPDQSLRALGVDALVAGELEPAEAGQLVTASGARFVFASCRFPEPLDADLAGVVAGPPKRFGCARVWEVREPARGWEP